MDSFVVNKVIEIGGINPHPMNYNRHPPGHIADLRTSLKKFGQVKSIVVQDDLSGGYLCVAGHGVLQAAILSGWKDIKADVIPGEWPQVKVLAYLAADNELARNSDPDLQQLAQLAHTIQQTDSDLARLAAGSDEALGRLKLLYDEAEQRRVAEERASAAAAFLESDDDDEGYDDDDDDDEGPRARSTRISGGGAVSTARDNPYVNLVFVADRIQRDFVLQTLAHVRDVYELETSVEAIVKLCELFEEQQDVAQETTG